MSGILDGKRLLITGVITQQSLGFGVAKYAQEQGAEVVLTGFGRMSLVERIAAKLPKPAPSSNSTPPTPSSSTRSPGRSASTSTASTGSSTRSPSPRLRRSAGTS
ncbi:hypothetical protein GCM10029992_42170 [Glycomyces albus]